MICWSTASHSVKRGPSVSCVMPRILSPTSALKSTRVRPSLTICSGAHSFASSAAGSVLDLSTRNAAYGTSNLAKVARAAAMARTRAKARRAAAHLAAVATGPLGALSHDEVGVVFEALATPLAPHVAVALASTCHGLRVPTVAALAAGGEAASLPPPLSADATLRPPARPRERPRPGRNGWRSL